MHQAEASARDTWSAASSRREEEACRAGLIPAARVRGTTPGRCSPDASGPATPSRGDVVSAMNSVQGAVSACGSGQHGLAPVRIVFGNNGRVQSAQVSGGSFPPPVRSCIARAVRGARVPPFRNPTFSVNYPFRL